MWKMLLAFAVFAVLAVFLLIKSGADVDMGGEKHGIETSEESHTASSAPEPAPYQVEPASAAAASAPAASAAGSAASM